MSAWRNLKTLGKPTNAVPWMHGSPKTTATTGRDGLAGPSPAALTMAMTRHNSSPQKEDRFRGASCRARHGFDSHIATNLMDVAILHRKHGE